MMTKVQVLKNPPFKGRVFKSNYDELKPNAILSHGALMLRER